MGILDQMHTVATIMSPKAIPTVFTALLPFTNQKAALKLTAIPSLTKEATNFIQ